MTAPREPRMMSGYDTAHMNQLASLYRARPFTRAIPFQKDLSTIPADGQGEVLWTPDNASFELGLLRVICNTAGVELALCDTTPQNPFVFFVPSVLPDDHITVDISPGYRSIISYQSARLILANPGGASGIVKGILYGWEFVAQAGGGQGYYRG